jgi:hypothetical protein
MAERTKKIVSLLFVALFMSFYANISLFTHTHVINGATIIHSHFHKETHHDTQSGGHTEHSITLIAQTSHFDCHDFLCNYILKPLPPLQKQIKIAEISHKVTSVHLQNLSLRAPPIV